MPTSLNCQLREILYDKAAGGRYEKENTAYLPRNDLHRRSEQPVEYGAAAAVRGLVGDGSDACQR